MNPHDDIPSVPPISREVSGHSQERPAAVKTVGQVLDHFKVDPKNLVFVDDPPGKLQAVEFKVKRKEKILRIEVQLKYTLELFSAERKWDMKVVRRATVLKVDPPDAW